MNVALVVLDTLRKDAFDAHFDWLPGRRFENTWSTSNWTLTAHTSLFTGRYSYEVGNDHGDLSIPADQSFLPEQLSAAGYTCRGYTANPVVSETFGFERGFDSYTGNLRYQMSQNEVFDWMRYMSESERDGFSRNALGVLRCMAGDWDTIASLKAGFGLKFRGSRLPFGSTDMGAQQALEMVRDTEFGDDEFLFVNLMEAHEPWRRPSAYDTVGTAEQPAHPLGFAGNETAADLKRIDRAYHEGVEYLSDVYRDLFEHLEADFEYVITVSDHGELLGEHDIYGHRFGVAPALTHVPLVVSGDSLSGSTDTPASLLDVHATVAAMAGVDIPSGGQDLLSNPTDERRLSMYHGLQIERERKVERLLDFGHTRAEIEAFDAQLCGLCLVNGGYAYETIDGIELEGDVDCPDPADAIERELGTLSHRERESETRAVPDSTRSQLKQLGYFS